MKRLLIFLIPVVVIACIVHDFGEQVRTHPQRIH